jgi:hypothetical protein
MLTLPLPSTSPGIVTRAAEIKKKSEKSKQASDKVQEEGTD